MYPNSGTVLYMAAETGSGESELTPEQQSRMEGFVEHYVTASNTDPTHTGYYDLASAFLRDSLGEKWGLEMDTPEKFYRVLAGLSLGTVWLEELVERGLSVKDAGEVMRTSLARLFPSS